MKPVKKVRWLGTSRQDISGFPEAVKADLGAELFRLQCGIEPLHWKPFHGLKRSAFELRAKDESGIFRVIYVTLIKENIYVLHCFNKKSQKTSSGDVSTANLRLVELLKGE